MNQSLNIDLFPIKVRIEATGEVFIWRSPSDIPHGVVFKILRIGAIL